MLLSDEEIPQISEQSHCYCGAPFWRRYLRLTAIYETVDGGLSKGQPLLLHR